jgi:hypothetical protein
MRGKADRILNLMPASSQDHTFRTQRSGRCADHSDAIISAPQCTHALTDISVIPCLEAKERGCDANVERKPKGGNQEHNAEGDKVFFHGHLPEF